MNKGSRNDDTSAKLLEHRQNGAHLLRQGPLKEDGTENAQRRRHEDDKEQTNS